MTNAETRREAAAASEAVAERLRRYRDIERQSGPLAFYGPKPLDASDHTIHGPEVRL